MIKKLLPWLTFILLLVLLILLFTQKDNLNNYLSKEIKAQNEIGVQQSIKVQIDSLYNYLANGQDYQITFLEFGATGCVACRKMEFVLEDVRMEYPEKVKVVFLNILQTQNQSMMKYYGVAAIPTQLLLDNNGREYFRHTGFYSLDDMKKEIDEQIIYKN